MSTFQWIVVIELGVLILVSLALCYDTDARLENIVTHVYNLYELCKAGQQEKVQRRYDVPRDPDGNPIAP